MKRINGKYLVLLTAGALLMSVSLILKHYFTITDAADGFLKGMGLGLMILALILTTKKKKKEWPASH
jgi:hypothetical protein